MKPPFQFGTIFLHDGWMIASAFLTTIAAIVLVINVIGIDFSRRGRHFTSADSPWFAAGMLLIVVVIGVIVIAWRLRWWAKLEPAQGTVERVERVEAGLRYHYSYEVNSQKFRSSQTISPKSAIARLQPGELIPIFLNPSAPKRVRLVS
jgi:TctA family transporter